MISLSEEERELLVKDALTPEEQARVQDILDKIDAGKMEILGSDAQRLRAAKRIADRLMDLPKRSP